MSSKKILFSISYYTPYVSGLTICAQRVADNIALDNEVTVLCMKHDNSLVNSEVINKVKIIRANSMFKIGKGFISIDWLFKSWRLVKSADTVVLNLPQFEGFIPAMIAKIFNKRVVSIYHCEIVMKNKIMQTIIEVANIISLWTADKIVVYTLDYADNSKLLKYFKHKWVEIYPPIPN